MNNCKILSIDAWKDMPGCWSWNNWFTVGDIPLATIPKTNRLLLRYMRDEGFLSDYSKGKISIDDDGYNITFLETNTQKPIFAIEYGPLI